MSKLRVWTDTESVEVTVGNGTVNWPQMVTALRFKAKNIKAHADPELFSAAADTIEKLMREAIAEKQEQIRKITEEQRLFMLAQYLPTVRE